MKTLTNHHHQMMVMIKVHEITIIFDFTVPGKYCSAECAGTHKHSV